MGKLGKKCIDCGGQAVGVVVDEVKPLFKMELVTFDCGAVLKSTYSANGNIGRAEHGGCLVNMNVNLPD